SPVLLSLSLHDALPIFRGGRGGPLPLSPSSVLSSIADHRSKRDLERSLARDLTRMRAFYKISLLASSEAKPGEIGARILGEFTRSEEHTSELQSRFDLV